MRDVEQHRLSKVNDDGLPISKQLHVLQRLIDSAEALVRVQQTPSPGLHSPVHIPHENNSLGVSTHDLRGGPSEAPLLRPLGGTGQYWSAANPIIIQISAGAGHTNNEDNNPISSSAHYKSTEFCGEFNDESV
ncbi:hypothetical protein FBUS_03219 [Fasciolopsis buskii]|uniref:Uncharacterized protein n=1 Tax=Fasciolopsis buskii TaxID=27845 RepID=A0A8E0VF20_9TREM|nr:hypothetical protein FBUS_03219 [Fasciolopsis buski]